jgi:N-methylhydantoinase B
VEFPDGRIEDHALTTRIPLPKGAVVHLRTGSGGGYGDPSERDPEDVRADLREGYITEDHARRHYPHAFPE